MRWWTAAAGDSETTAGVAGAPGNDGLLHKRITEACAADLQHRHALTRGPDPDIQTAPAALTLRHRTVLS